MRRRIFLQRIGSVIAVLGITETQWLSSNNRYYQALAQSNSRKLALLIGINNYLRHPALKGCLTDVELQKELLVYRFGFQPSDILCLTDEQASKDLIEKAFFEHLINQVKPGDVVFFHFSGYGGRIQSENALITADGNNAQNTPNVNYLREKTLLLMLRSLPTEHVIAILDTSFNIVNDTNKGLAIRAYPTILTTGIDYNDLDLQKQLKEKINTTLPALILSATSNQNQLAREAQMSGFNAGLFTYALTQYLWENTPATTVKVSLERVTSVMQQLGSNQQPNIFNGNRNQQRQILNSNFLPSDSITAEGAITAIEEDGKTLQLWLGGIAPQILEYYNANSQFQVIANSDLPLLTLRSRLGLTAKAAIIGGTDSSLTPQPGQLIQEVVRAVPKNINLNIALDNALERIERVDATSAFATLSRVKSVIAGEEAADYLFAKLPEKSKDISSATSTVVSPSRYGLFTLSGELIANTSGEVGEAVKVAVQRLAPTFKTLLAAKLWRITNNEASSRLGVKAKLETINGATSQPVMQRETVRYNSLSTNQQFNSSYASTPNIAIGNRIQVQVENQSTHLLYLMILGLDNSKNTFALYSWQKSEDNATSDTNPQLQNITIAPGTAMTIPQTTPGFEWMIQGLNNLCEINVICSTSPFTQTLTALASAKNPKSDKACIQLLSNPREVTQALFSDLHNSAEKKDVSDVYMWNVNNWASLSFVFQVVSE